MKKILLIIFFLSQALSAQDLGLKLKQAYDSFENKKVDSLLIAANKSITVLSLDEKIAFHKYSAFQAFQNGMQEIVMDHFKELVTLDPSYTLDALSTSPKLIMLFDKSKIEYLEEQQRRLHELTKTQPEQELPWRSLVYPGWEQWHRGAKTKAYTWVALGTLTLAGTVQSLFRTSAAHTAYLDETSPGKIKSKFRTYNDLYRSQYYWAYALTTVWIASHLDAVFFTEPSKMSLVIQPGPQNGISLDLKFRF
jgi:hypothetical protein